MGTGGWSVIALFIIAASCYSKRVIWQFSDGRICSYVTCHYFELGSVHNTFQLYSTEYHQMLSLFFQQRQADRTVEEIRQAFHVALLSLLLSLVVAKVYKRYPVLHPKHLQFKRH